MSIERVVLAKVMEAGTPKGLVAGARVKLTLFGERLYRHVAIRVADLSEAFRLEKTP